MIQGPRVRIRPLEQDDLDYLVLLANDEVVRQNVVGWDWPISRSAQDAWFDRSLSSSSTKRFVVEDHNGNPLGMTGLWDIDWHNRNALTALKLGGSSDVRNKGFGSEAILLMMRFAFYDVGLSRLYSSILTRNEASIRAYVHKCGWSEEGISRQHVWRDGQYLDLVQVGVLASDFEARRDEFEARLGINLND